MADDEEMATSGIVPCTVMYGMIIGVLGASELARNT
jgi:hypothetical protein